MRMTSLSRCLVFVLTVALALPARATWSIVVVDRETGEVCVAAATCVNTQLDKTLPSIVPGIGVAAAQKLTDGDGSNLALIQDGLLALMTPQEILDALAASDPGHQSRQYGIVSLFAPPVTFTGSDPGDAQFGVTGEVGSLAYAIQGNVLTGVEVVLAAEAALLGTQGDLSQRAMAAMEVARSLGGDGRCSCSVFAPTSCGVPPPSFTKSALSSFIVLARPGDQPVPCGPLLFQGCVTGASFYLHLKDKGQGQFGDTVTVLGQKYADWRASLAGVTDAYHTAVEVSADELVAGGHSEARVVLRLADIDGVPIGHGGQTVGVRRISEDPPVAWAGPVRNLGDGTFEFTLRATYRSGRATFRLVVQDETYRVQLPDLTIHVSAPSRVR